MPPRQGRWSQWRPLAMAGLALWCALACSDEGRPTGPATGAALTVTSGDDQDVYLGMRAGQSLAVLVADEDGNPVGGVRVGFAVIRGTARLSDPVATTDARGMATTEIVVGDVPGEVVVAATTGEGGPRAEIVVTGRPHPRLPADEVLGYLAAVWDTTSARGAVRAALAGAGLTLADSSGGALTADGGSVTVSPSAVAAVVALEATGRRQSLHGFYGAYRASGFAILDAVGGPIDSEAFLESLRDAVWIALRYPEREASGLPLMALAREGVPADPETIDGSSQISPAQSLLLLLALADVANPTAVPEDLNPTDEDFFSGTARFPLGLVVAGGLIAVSGHEVTVAAPPPGQIALALEREAAWARFLDGEGLSLGGGRRLETNHATVAAAEDGPMVVVVEASGGASRDLAPVAAIAFPMASAGYEEGMIVKLRGSGRDEEDGALSGAGLVWVSDRDGELGVGEVAEVSSLSAGTHLITLTVTDSHGQSAHASVEITVKPKNRPPEVTISSPADGSVFSRWTGVPLLGTAEDDEDGPLSGSAMAWYSDHDGHLGAGESKSIDWLEVGTHTISLSARDSRGLRSVATVQITIVEADSGAASDDSILATGESQEFGLANGATMECVWIGPGEFTMGGASGDASFPERRVIITEGYWLGKYEITQGQWQAVMGTAPWAGKNHVHAAPDHPAVHISWDDTQEMVSRMNTALGAEVYRLPTEAEWEYACRAGTDTHWSYGDYAFPDHGDTGDYAWYSGNVPTTGHAQAVGTKRPNPWGLHDMHGNVWEWVEDWFAKTAPPEPLVDPIGPDTGTARVMRGGSFFDSPWRLGSAIRYAGQPRHYSAAIGVRLLRQE